MWGLNNIVGDPPGPLIRADAAMKSLGYPEKVIQDYFTLANADLHLSEIYRQRHRSPHLLANPIIVDCTPAGKAWVDFIGTLNENPACKAEIQSMQARHELVCSIYDAHFISGQVLVEQLPVLVAHMTSLQAARPITACDFKSLRDMSARRSDLQELRQSLWHEYLNLPELTGKGVVVGFIDTGCDFKHPNFLTFDGRTRIKYLWDQTQPTIPGCFSTPYGREYSQSQINAVISKDGYSQLGYQPKKGSHGTQVMDVAVGCSPAIKGKRRLGVAPEADIIFVHLGQANCQAAQDGAAGTHVVGNSKRLMDALEYIFKRAGSQPVVINLSLECQSGAHDGSSILEQYMDTRLNQSHERAIVVAAGNSYGRKMHVGGQVTAQPDAKLDWNVPVWTHSHFPGACQEIEIWYHSQDWLEMEISDKSGSLGACGLGAGVWWSIGQNSQQPVLVVGQRTAARASHSQPAQRQMDILLDPSLKTASLWTVELRLADPSSKPVNFHAWLTGNDGCPSSLESTVPGESSTLNTLATGTLPLAVGVHFPETVPCQLGSESSAGPSLNPGWHFKPEVTAPGEGIRTAKATVHEVEETMPGYGTSLAAAHVSGLIALMYQAAAALELSPLSLSTIRDCLISTSELDLNIKGSLSHGGRCFDPRYGFGRVKATEALRKLIETAKRE